MTSHTLRTRLAFTALAALLAAPGTTALPLSATARPRR